MNHLKRLKIKAEKLLVSDNFFHSIEDLNYSKKKLISPKVFDSINISDFVVFYYSSSTLLGIHLNGLLIIDMIGHTKNFLNYKDITTVSINEFSKEHFTSFDNDISTDLIIKIKEKEAYKLKINKEDNVFGILRLINYAINFFNIRMN